MPKWIFNQNGTSSPWIGTPNAVVAGLESEMVDNPNWVNEVFTEESEAPDREVWGGLKADSDIKKQILDFWAEGKISDEWQVDEDGVIDLTKLVVLVE